MARRKFIRKAIRRPGALTRKARRARMTVNAYARKHAHDPGTTGRQARFYLNVLRPANQRRRRKRT